MQGRSTLSTVWNHYNIRCTFWRNFEIVSQCTRVCLLHACLSVTYQLFFTWAALIRFQSRESDSEFVIIKLLDFLLRCYEYVNCLLFSLFIHLIGSYPWKSSLELPWPQRHLLRSCLKFDRFSQCKRYHFSHAQAVPTARGLHRQFIGTLFHSSLNVRILASVVTLYFILCSTMHYIIII